MNKKRLSDILRYSRSDEILVVDTENRVAVFKCPFNVLALEDVGELLKQHIYEVEQVKITPKLVTLFIIDGKAYYYYHFDIII